MKEQFLQSCYRFLLLPVVIIAFNYARNLLRFITILLLFTDTMLTGQPLPTNAPTTKVSFAWDYVATTNLPDFSLLWGTNRITFGTNQTGTVAVSAGLQSFTAIATRNGIDSDPSNAVRIRVIALTLEKSADLLNWHHVGQSSIVVTSNVDTGFYRVRVWQQ